MIETLLVRNITSTVTVLYVLFYFEHSINYVINSEYNSFSAASGAMAGEMTVRNATQCVI